MKIRLFEKALLRNPVRRYLQRKIEAPRLFRGVPSMIGGRRLEIGSGYGHGSRLSAIRLNHLRNEVNQ